MRSLAEPLKDTDPTAGQGHLPRVLFVNSNYEDYLADGIFHGLRMLLGGNVVDFPKAEYMYEDASRAIRSRARGGGFTLYGLLRDIQIERDRVFQRATAGEFDLVIFGAIWACFGLWTQWGPTLARAGIPMVVLDGADAPKPYPYSWLWWKKSYWWFLPRAQTRASYFKRELTPKTRWFASYLLLPPQVGRSLGIRPIAFSIPAEKIVTVPSGKEKDFPSHIVDSELAERFGGKVEHVFSNERDYYADLRSARFGITCKRAGWDALRHYEIAASGAIPCFRNLDRKPATCAPFGLDDSNCIMYRNAEDLSAQISALDEDGYSRLQAGALSWVRENTTVVRASEVLAACGVQVTP